jgi:hypothetical protein
MATSGAAAHGDAEIGLGERGRVVHAVADHRDGAPPVLQPPDDIDLVGRHHFRAHGVDPDLRRDPLRCRLVVTGEQDWLEAEPAQMTDRRPRSWA